MSAILNDSPFPPSPFDKYLRLFSYYNAVKANQILLDVDNPASNFLRAMLLDNSYVRRNLDTFEEFKATYLHHVNNCYGLAFRGQPGLWPPRSKLTRFLDDFEKIHESFPLPGPNCRRAHIVYKILERLRGLLNTDGKTPDPQMDYLWASLQHYGGATPLLDWTQSLDIALFFAFDDLPTKEHDRVVLFIADIGKLHVMNYEAVKKKRPDVRDLLDGDYEEFRASWTFIWPMNFGDIRFPMQQSVFLIEGEESWSRDADSFEAFIANPPPHEPEFRPLPGTLLAVTLPATERPAVQSYLAKKGVTRERLFMGWDGVAKHLMSQFTNDMLVKEWWKENVLSLEEAESFLKRVKPSGNQSS